MDKIYDSINLRKNELKLKHKKLTMKLSKKKLH